MPTARRWPRPSASLPAIRRWFLPAKRANSRRRSARRPQATRSCCRAAIAPRVRRTFGRQHPRFLPGVPADGGGHDLRRRVAHREGRTGRRTIRKAPVFRPGDDRRRQPTGVPRRHRQRHRVHSRRARARSSPTIGGLSPVRGDAQPVARLRQWRLRQSRERPSLDAGFRQGQPAIRTLSRTRRPDHRDARLHARDRPRRRSASGTAVDGLLHLSRGAAARLRTGDDAARFHLRRLLRDLRPHDLDRRPDTPARRRSCRILPGLEEPDRPQMRPVADARTSLFV